MSKTARATLLLAAFRSAPCAAFSLIGGGVVATKKSLLSPSALLVGSYLDDQFLPSNVYATDTYEVEDVEGSGGGGGGGEISTGATLATTATTSVSSSSVTATVATVDTSSASGHVVAGQEFPGTTSRDLMQMEYITPPPPTTQISIPSFVQKEGRQSFSLDGLLNNPSLGMGRLLVLVASAVYGTNFAMVKMLDDVMPMPVSASLRFALASAVVTGVVLANEKPAAMKEQEDRNAALMAGCEIGLWYAIGYLCQASALQTVEAGKSAFFSSLAIVVVPLLDAAFKSKILKQRDLASLALACLGVGLLELGPAGGFSLSSGDIMALGQTAFFGLGYWRLESVSHRLPNQAGRITVGQLAAVAAGAIGYAVVGSGIDMPTISQFSHWFSDPFVLGALSWTGLVSTALALYLETVALKVVTASELTLLMTTVSLWGAGFAYLSIGEVLSTTGMLGGLLILSGCVLGNISDESEATINDETL